MLGTMLVPKLGSTLAQQQNEAPNMTTYQILFTFISETGDMACVMNRMVLDPWQKISGVRKERRARAVRGKNLVYFCYNRTGDAIISQKLPLIRDYINSLCEDKWNTVTVTGLYENCGVENNRVGGYHKGWRVKSFPLECAGAEFERLRQCGRFEKVVVVAEDPSCYECA